MQINLEQKGAILELQVDHNICRVRHAILIWRKAQFFWGLRVTSVLGRQNLHQQVTADEEGFRDPEINLRLRSIDGYRKTYISILTRGLILSYFYSRLRIASQSCRSIYFHRDIKKPSESDRHAVPQAEFTLLPIRSGWAH